MSSIDERVVNMKFNNSGFAAGIRSTLSMLDSLKAKLNFGSATKSVQDLDAAGRKFSLAPMGQGIEAMSTKFSALSVAGIAALAAIGVKAASVGIQMAKSLTIDPIMQGLQEYETGLNSVQTILANTQHENTNLGDVSGALKELNHYADQTIYNFAEMAKNIGTFTAAGVSLDTSTSAIKGIANLAAVSGSNSQQASTAMYQLSQAMSAGKATLMDWNSVVNAGMGGKVFQDALIETARNQGVAIDSIIEKNGSFRDSLQEGWMTTDVLTETLSKFTGDLTDQQLKTMGYTEDQIKGIQEMAVVAKDAATKVKTFSQLTGTLQEAAQSGWAQSWETIIGDFEQAKDLWTGVNDTIGGMIGKSADARNNMLKDWAALGGRDAAIDAIRNAFEALMSVLGPIGEAFRDIFTPTTGAELARWSVALRDFTSTLKLSESSMESLKSTFRGIFAVIDIGRMFIVGLLGVLGNLFSTIMGGSGSVLTFTGNIGDFLVKIRDAIKHGEGLNNFFRGLEAVLKVPIMLLGALGQLLGSAFQGLANSDILDGFGDAIGRLEGRMGGLPDIGAVISTVWEGVLSVFKRVKEFFAPLATELGDFFGEFGTMVANALNGMNFDKALDLVNTGLFAALVVMLKNFLGGGFVDQLKDAFGFGDKGDDSPGFLDSIKETLGGVTDTLSAMQAQLKAGTLMKIAAAIGILTASVVALSMIDSEKLTKALTALTVMFTQLGIAGTALQYAGTIFGAVKLGVLAAGLILLSTAVLILSAAVKNMADLDWEGLAKGLVGVAGILGALAVAARIMSKHSGGLITAGVGMIAVAAAVKILASAVEDFSDLSWEDLAKGLGSVAAILVSLGIFSKLATVGKGAFASAAGLVVIAAAMKIFASAVDDFADMDWDELGRGLAGMAGALVAVGVAMRLMPKGMAVNAVGLIAVAGALKVLASALGDMSGMSWDEIGRGLTVLAGSLGAIAIAMKLMTGAVPGSIALIAVAGALTILSPVLQTFAAMGWDEIGRGLTVLGGSLGIIAIAMMGMVGALPGAAALIVVAGALMMLAPVLISLGEMTWTEIAMGLIALAGAFTVIGLAGVLLTPVVPVLLGLGAAIALLGIGAVGVGIALSAMATALTVLAISGAAAGTALVAMVAGLLGLIPLAFVKLGEGIVALAGVITAGAPAIVGAIVAVLMSLMQAIIDISPQIGQTLTVLVGMMIDVLLNNVPRLVDAGMQLLLGILNGINSHIGQIVAVATQIIVNFINGIAAGMPQIAQAGANLAVSFINSTAEAIRANSGAMSAAGLNLAGAIIDGMVNGVSAGIGRVAAAAGNVAKSALDQVKSFLGIASPSKEFHKIGAWSSEGMALGIEHTGAMVGAAASAVGGTAMSAMKDSLMGLGDTVTEDIDFDPTVRPVLDLTAFKKDAALVNGMLGDPSISTENMYNRAMAIASTQRSDDTALGQATGDIQPKAIHYEQNNYSPKALSAIEIYRQTNNQISRLKG